MVNEMCVLRIISRDTREGGASGSHGLSETPIVWRNTSVTFAREDEV